MTPMELLRVYNLDALLALLKLKDALEAKVRQTLSEGILLLTVEV